MDTNITDGLLNFDNATYDYDDTYEDQRCDTSSPRQVGMYITIVFVSVEVILSLFGNILVIVVLVKYENVKSLNNVLIMNLAVSDLLFTIGLPLWFYFTHSDGWTLGVAACKTVAFVFSAGYYSGGILLILMTTHRYIAVMNPLSRIVSNKGFCSALASPVIWAASLVFAVPASISTSVWEKKCVTVSSKWTLIGTYQQNIFFILNSVVFLFCYPQIICRLLRPTAQRRKSKTLKLIFILMAVFLVTWAPYNIVIFLQSFQSYPKTHDASTSNIQGKCNFTKHLQYAFYISRLFAFSQCCLNPVFYVFVGVKFKKHLTKMLKSWGHKSHGSSIQTRQSRLTITSITSGEEFVIHSTIF